MQTGADNGYRVVVASEHQSPVLAEIGTQGRLQSAYSRTKLGDVRGDGGEIPFRFGAFCQQTVSKNFRLLLRFSSQSLGGTTRGFHGLFLQLRSTGLAQRQQQHTG